MPQYRRPSLVTADPWEATDHLLSKGIKSSITYDDTALLITIAGTSDELTAALADYTPVAIRGEYRPPRPPLPGDLPTHVAHLVTIARATPAQLAAMTDAQVRHALQDVCKALALLIDDRLG